MNKLTESFLKQTAKDYATPLRIVKEIYQHHGLDKLYSQLELLVKARTHKE